MSKRMSEADLNQMGLYENDDGMFSKHKEVKTVLEEVVAPPYIFIPHEVISSKSSKQILWIFKAMKGKVSAKMQVRGMWKPVTPIISESSVAKEYRKKTARHWEGCRKYFHKMIEGKKKPYLIEFTFIRKTRRKYDFHNMVQLPCDIMQDYGWIEDDDVATMLPVPPLPPLPPHIIDKARCGVEIRVL